MQLEQGPVVLLIIEPLPGKQGSDDCKILSSMAGTVLFGPGQARQDQFELIWAGSGKGQAC